MKAGGLTIFREGQGAKNPKKFLDPTRGDEGVSFFRLISLPASLVAHPKPLGRGVGVAEDLFPSLTKRGVG